jgi:hypothetical protein
MTITELVFTTLSAAATVTAKCPAARIKVPGAWQDLALPYITHAPVALSPTVTHEGLQALRVWDYYQVDVWASSYGQGEELALAVLTALSGVHGGAQFIAKPGAFYAGGDPDLNVEHFVVSFEAAEAL